MYSAQELIGKSKAMQLLETHLDLEAKGLLTLFGFGSKADVEKTWKGKREAGHGLRLNAVTVGLSTDFGWPPT
jgi:hypothetical protein